MIIKLQNKSINDFMQELNKKITNIFTTDGMKYCEIEQAGLKAALLLYGAKQFYEVEY